jgi:hypothetical protein
MSLSLARSIDNTPPGAPAASGSDTSAEIIPFPNSRRHYGAEPQDPWQVYAIKRVVALINLAPNWDGYRAPRVNLDTGMFALRVLNDIMLARTPIPQIVPSSVGGIQLEWHVGGINLEIHITKPYEGDVWFEDHGDGSTEAGEMSEDISQLQRLVRRLTLSPGAQRQ